MSLKEERKYHHLEEDLLPSLLASWPLYQLPRTFNSLTREDKCRLVRETLLSKEEADLFESASLEEEPPSVDRRQLWGLRRLVPPGLPALRLQDPGLVSERNVLEDVVFLKQRAGDDAAAALDLTAELNIEVVYSRRPKGRRSPLQTSILGGSNGDSCGIRRRWQSRKMSPTTTVKTGTTSAANPLTAPDPATSSITKKKNNKTGPSHVISLPTKKKSAAVKRSQLLDSLVAKVTAIADPSSSSGVSNTMLLRECNVRARLLAIPPQILEGTTSSTASSDVERSAAAALYPKPLLPFHIAKSLQRRGLPRVCVKYAEIVPPKRETVLELLRDVKLTVGKKRPSLPRSHPPSPKVAKTERKNLGGTVLEALIPVREDYLGRNNPFHLGSTEERRKARSSICNREDSRRNRRSSFMR